MYFDQFKHQLPDIDPAETQEWLDALTQVVEQEGENRARFLIFKLLKRARQLQSGQRALLPGATKKPTVIAMEEVRRGLIQYWDPAAQQPEKKEDDQL